MIHGAHIVLYSSDAEADRAFFRDVLEYPCVDAGHNWLIFALPPAELAVHPAESDGGHELFLMCDDIEAFVKQMSRRNVVCAELSTERWGSLTRLTLPSGGTIGVYQPSHPSPLTVG
jgi:catechol 2,3-dioxygenase-like lactoylglutathione lyase family enzyme